MGQTAPTTPTSPTSPPNQLAVPPTIVDRIGQITVDDWINISLVVGGPLVVLGLWIGNVIRPGSLQAGGTRGVSSHGTWAWLMAALVAFVFAQAARSGLIEVAHVYSFDLDGERGTALKTLAYVVPGVAISLFLAYLLEGKGGNAGLKAEAVDFPVGVGCLLLAIPVIFGAQVAAVWIQHGVSSSATESIGHVTLKSLASHPNDPWVWVSIASAVVLAPIYEEFVYRGFVQSAMLRFTDMPGVAIVCTSAIFTAMHWGSINTWYGLVPIFVLSLGLGIAFEKTKRIGVPIVMHTVFNAANVAMVVLAK